MCVCVRGARESHTQRKRHIYCACMSEISLVPRCSRGNNTGTHCWHMCLNNYCIIICFVNNDFKWAGFFSVYKAFSPPLDA